MKKRKAGRPKLPKDQVNHVIAVRLSESERSEYERRASKQGLKLSDWIRQTLQQG
jgi:predicted DNA binding CopG/RHH family protein